jgi:AAA family ATP:ADP antiporter
LLLSTASTFLYFEQARLVGQTFPDRADRTQVFGTIDTVVQALSIGAQLFVTGHVARRLGVGVLLVAVPILVAVGFLALSIAPVFLVLAVVMIVRRAGEYAFVRPGREMLQGVLSPEAKYKAKNFNDTVVYRGGDAVSGWVKNGIDALASHPAAAMLIGAVLSVVWAVTGGVLARAHKRRAGD